MDVTDVLRDRMGEPTGLSRMVGVSMLVHAAFGAFLVFGSAHLFGRPAAARANVMTISISGAGEGPRNGGFTDRKSVV